MKRILVVEDDLALSTGLCFELDAAGYASLAAYNCAKASYLLAHEVLDLVLLDVNLPDGSGFDLCRKFKETKPELPVIFLTANDLENDVLNGFDMGAEDYVTKPFNMQILLCRVEVALRRAGSATAAPAADKMKQYVNPTELTAELLNTLIEKIVVHEAVKGEDGSREQEVEIFYRFIGKID